jgi:hypothetical protein
MTSSKSFAPDPTYPMGVVNNLLRVDSPKIAAVIDRHFNEDFKWEGGGDWSLLCRQFLLLWAKREGIDMDNLAHYCQAQRAGVAP